MNPIYSVLLIIHVLSAIIGIGTTFTFSFLIAYSQSPDKLQWSYSMIGKLGVLPKYADIILLITGLIMIKMAHYSSVQMWIAASIVLFIILKIFTDILFPARLKKIENNISQLQGTVIPRKITVALHKIFVFEYVINASIVVLMVIKPS